MGELYEVNYATIIKTWDEIKKKGGSKDKNQIIEAAQEIFDTDKCEVSNVINAVGNTLEDPGKLAELTLLWGSMSHNFIALGDQLSKVSGSGNQICPEDIFKNNHDEPCRICKGIFKYSH